MSKKTDDDKLAQQDQIVKQLTDVKTDQANVQNQKALVDEIIEKMPEFDRVADLEGQLEAARDSLKQAKLNSQPYQEAADVLTELRVALNASRKVLSALLVKWTAKYQQRNVLLGMEMHEIVLTAKLGRELDSAQGTLPLFEDDQL